MVDSLIFALKEIHPYLQVDPAIASTMKNSWKLKQWMNTLEFMTNKRYFVDHHRSYFAGIQLDGEVMLGAREDKWYHFLDVSVTMQTMFNLRSGELPLIPSQPDMTFHTLLHVSSPECYLLQVGWNRESEADKQEYMKKKKNNKNKKHSEYDLYYKYVKEGDKKHV